MFRGHTQLTLSAFAAAILAACGGSSEVAPIAPAVLFGTASAGAAVAAASVDLTDAQGNPACQEANLTTGADGTYTCTLVSGATAPFLLVVSDPVNLAAPLVAVGDAVPAVGQSLRLNATPLTTAIVAQLDAADDPTALGVDRSNIDIAKLDIVRSKVLAQLADLLAALGLGEEYDPFDSEIVATTVATPGNAADRLLDLLRVTRVGGQLLIAPVDRPADAVPVADAGMASPAKLPMPADTGTGTDLIDDMRALAKSLQACFAMSVADRVTARDESIAAVDGGPSATVAEPCAETTRDTYLNNGYRGGQAFYGLLTSDAMTGASFQMPEVMARLPDASDPTRMTQAIVIFRYRLADGSSDRLIQVVHRADDGRWQLHGNQQRVESGIRAMVRRTEQFAPNPGTPPFANTPSSRFETGLSIFVNRSGPGSVGLRAARFKGPGLPTAGLVLTPPDASVCGEQSWMNVRRKDGDTSPSAATPVARGGTAFMLDRTGGIDGSAATVRRPNPNEGNEDHLTYTGWAHPKDYGQSPGSTDYIDFANLKAMGRYTVELFYEGETAPRYTYEKRALTPILPARDIARMPWVTLDKDSRGYLDPSHAGGPAAPRWTIGWLADPLAEPIISLGVYSGTAGAGPVNQPDVLVNRGETTVDIPAPDGAACSGAPAFPALSADGSSYRLVILQHQMSDGSKKEVIFRYN